MLGNRKRIGLIEQTLNLFGMTTNERVIASEAKQSAKIQQGKLPRLYSLLRFARNDSFVWFKFRTRLLGGFFNKEKKKSVQYLFNTRHPFSYCATSVTYFYSCYPMGKRIGLMGQTLNLFGI